MKVRRGETRNLVAAVIIAAAVAVGIYFFVGAGPSEPVAQDNETEEFTTYASVGEEAGSTDVRNTQEFEEVRIIEGGVAPSRVSTEIGGAVRWTNERGFPVRIDFERISEDLVIEPGQTGAMKFRAISYYRVFNDEGGQKVAQGSVVVG